MKRSAYFTFTVKAICCAFLFGIVQVGCEKVDSSAVVPPETYQKLENPKEEEEKLKENVGTSLFEVPK